MKPHTIEHEHARAVLHSEAPSRAARRRFAVGFAMALASCGTKARAPGAPPRTLLIRVGALDVAKLRVHPAHIVQQIVPRAPFWAAIVLTGSDVDTIRVEHPDGCPLSLSAARRPTNDPSATPSIESLLPSSEFAAPVGHDAPFSIDARPRCGRRPRAQWRVEPANTPFSLSDDGLVLHARTLARSPAPPGLARGVEPVSFASQGRIRVSVTLSFDDRPTIERRFERVAASRNGGVPSSSTQQSVGLVGAWALDTSSADRRAEPELSGQWPAQRLVLRETGSATLRSDDGLALRVTANDHDRLPLDCARSECHQRESRAWERSPMQSAFVRSAAAPDDRAHGCAIACHTVGEPGVDDGGFEHRARTLGYSMLPGDPRSLPSILATAATIGCASCHGPAALPTPDWRWTILRSAVCAQCHDAPPRYAHVASWNSTAMARFRPETNEPACRRCHDTDAFLRAMSLRRSSLEPPPAANLGLTCATCHAVHDEQTLARSVRRAPVPRTLAGIDSARIDRTQPCVSCHTPEADDALTGPTAAWFFFAPGATPALAPHANLERGCVTCHRAEPQANARGLGHTFAANTNTCASCHSAPGARSIDPTARARLEARVAALQARLIEARIATRSIDRLPHAAAWTVAAHATDAERAAVRWVLRVAEDRGAWAHNLPLAQSLLDRAEQALAAPATDRARDP